MASSTTGATGRPASVQPRRWRSLAFGLGLAMVVAACSTAAAPTPFASVAGATATPVASPSASASPTDTPTATPTATAIPTDTPTPTPTLKPAPKVTPLPPLGIGLCTGYQLKLTLDYWIPATTTPGDNAYAHAHATNISSASCTMRGTPRTQIIDGNGKVIVDSGNGGSEIKTTDTAYTLAPSGVIYVIIEWDNWCASSPKQNVTVATIQPFGLGGDKAKANGAAPVAYCSSSGHHSTVLAQAWTP
jgi:hypothetical protein